MAPFVVLGLFVCVVLYTYARVGPTSRAVFDFVFCGTNMFAVIVFMKAGNWAMFIFALFSTFLCARSFFSNAARSSVEKDPPSI